MSLKKSKLNSTSRSSSPVHVHVDKDTPVHVYVDKDDQEEISSYANSLNRKLRTGRPVRPNGQFGAVKSLRKPKNNRIRSVSPPWVPPPGKTTKHTNGVQQYWNEQEVDISQQERYETQINLLQDEIGQLKEQLQLEQYREEQLRANQQETQARTDQIDEMKQEIDIIEKENEMLRYSQQESMDTQGKLISLLIDTELAAQTTEHQLQHCFDNFKNILQDGHKVTSREVDKLSTLVHDTQERTFNFQQQSEQLRLALQTHARSSLLDPNVIQRQLNDKQLELDKLQSRLNQMEQQSLGYNTTQQSLENIRGHLQQQLRQKSGDCNRMAVQVRTLENELARERMDKEHLTELLKSGGGASGNQDREMLKKAARAQKQRAQQADQELNEMVQLLAEKDRQIEQMMKVTPRSSKENHLVNNGPMMDHHNKSSQTDMNSTQTQQNTMDSHEDQMRLRKMDQVIDENEHLYNKINDKEHERLIVALRRENESLRSIADECEVRLKQVEREMQTLRDTIGDESQNSQNEDHLNKLVAENRSNIQKIEELERKNRKLEQDKEEFRHKLDSKNSDDVSTKSKSDDLLRENASLMRQLETALSDSRKRNTPTSNDGNEQKSQERSFQQKLHDLETQLAQQRADAAKWRRNCEEIERKSDSRFQDVRLQLEQAERTNNSLQTYVQFLKKSYSSVFGDMPNLTTSKLGSFGYGSMNTNY